MNRTKKIVAYSLYVTGVTVFFLYMLFPSDTIRTYAEHIFAELSPGTALTIEWINPTVPPGIRFANASIQFEKETVVRFDHGHFVPAYLSMISSRPRGNFSAAVGNGMIDGTISVHSEKDDRTLSSRINLAAVDLGAIPILNGFYPANASGNLDGEIFYEASMHQGVQPNGNGSAIFTIAGLRVNLDEDILGMNQFLFSSVKAEAQMENGLISIKRLDMEGNQFSASGKGTLLMRYPIESSKIDLAGTIQLHPEIIRQFGALIPRHYLEKGEVPVRITGTLAAPRYMLR